MEQEGEISLTSCDFYGQLNFAASARHNQSNRHPLREGERRRTMFRFKFFSVLMAVTLVVWVGMFHRAQAGEKVKMHGTSVVTQWHQMEVGDEDGHVIAIFETKQVYFDEKTGEKLTRVAKNLSDLNFKTGKGTMTSYGVITDANGDKRFNHSEGRLVGKGRWEGTSTYINGTGKMTGIKGRGTWVSQALGNGISYVEAESEIDLPDQPGSK
jgi:hypothetical protein